jgi:ABC-type lipoprotein export system ATPase subunit
MEFRQHTISAPMQKTCLWLFEHENYKKWRRRDSLHDHQGLLWIKGKPGSGKSTLIKAAFAQVKYDDSQSTTQRAAAFFFNARGQTLEKSPLGMF